MHWQAEPTRPVRSLVWACLILAVAAYGAVVVRSVTDALVGIATHQRVTVQSPYR
jgi:hypothetical protein